MFGAKRLSVVRYLKQNNEMKIAADFKLYNTVFAVTDPEKNVNCCHELLDLQPSRSAGVVFANRFKDSRTAFRGG